MPRNWMQYGVAAVTCVVCVLLLVVDHSGGTLYSATGSHGDPGAASLSGGRTVLPLVYYFDVEPKEQKYLKLATNYEDMVRARAQQLQHAGYALQPLPSHDDDNPTAALHTLTASGRLMLPSSSSQLPERMALATRPDSDDAIAARSQLQGLRVPQLLKLLREKSADCNGCSEKAHLIERVLEVRGWLSREDTVVLALASLQDSAATQLLPHHLGMALTEAQQRELVTAQIHKGQVAYHLECGPDLFRNGTVHCERRRELAAAAR